MTSTPPVVARRATPADLGRTAAVLGEAFSTDPVFLHLLPPGVRSRDARLRRFFALEVPRSQSHAALWTTEDGAGAAVWYPPGHWEQPTADALRQVPAGLRVFGRQVPLALRVQALLHRHHPRAPHWYLGFLGTRTDRQGTGVGGALLRAVTAECDATGVPAYLEASSERSRALYLRHGFVGDQPMPLPAGGPPVWPMWREPGASAREDQ